MAWYEITNQKISSIFYAYGKLVARHQRKFMVCPLLMAAILSLGVVFLTFENDAIYLFTPPSSRAQADLKYMQEQFPISYDNYFPSRSLSTQEKGGNLYITSTDGGNILRSEIISEILDVDAKLQAMEVTVDGVYRVNFSEICAIVNNHCLSAPLLNLLSLAEEYQNNFNITYPVTVVPDGTGVFIGYSLGGVVLVENNLVISAEALAIHYPLQSGTPDKDFKALLWEDAFTEVVSQYNSSEVQLSYLTSQSLSNELLAMTERVMPLIFVTFSILIIFAVASCLMSDWVQGKPWLGVFGLVSAFLAISSTVGLLSACGVAFNQVVASMPFLVIGIGIDDMFIMVAAWRHTNRRLPVEERMGLAFSDAAVSITITSVTDALAFGIGAITPLPAVRIFCLYAGVAIVFDYVYQITFFGACMVYTGQREEGGKHCFSCKKVLSKEEAPSICYRMFCAGGISTISAAEEKPSEQAITHIFRKYYSPFIVSPVVKVFVVFLFMGYLAIAFWGCLHVQEGLQLKDIFADDSYARRYYQDQTDYFTKFGHAVSVAITTKQNYWESSVRNDIEALTQNFESNRFVHEAKYTESWIRDFSNYLHRSLNKTNVDKETFMHLLCKEFLTMPEYEKYKEDIKFSLNQTDIESSRFIVKSTDVVLSTDETEFMLDLRKKADSVDTPLAIFSPIFIFIEQYVIVVPNTIQALLIATACMFIVALFLMPHPVCAVMVTVCIVTIEIGVIGMMSLWNVKLDGISMINIILCIGFSVDFSAHMTYAFITSSGTTGNERAMDALHTLGTPILQGGLSTMLSISVLSSSPAYIFRAFFRTMFFVMLFGLFHSLIFLPVFLSFLNPFLPRKSRPNEAPNSEQPLTSSCYCPIPKTDGIEPTLKSDAHEPTLKHDASSSLKYYLPCPKATEEVFIFYNNTLISLDSIDTKETVL